MIVLVGGAEQPGAAIVEYLNKANFNDLVIVHDHKDESVLNSLSGNRFTKKIRYKEISRFLEANQLHVQFMVVVSESGLVDTNEIWDACIKWGIPLIVVSKEQTGFNKLVKINAKQPFYWSILHYRNESEEQVPKMVLHLMEHRKESAVHYLTNLAV
ncbi:hypothetical protein NF867_09430 [Solitalea sp. MAHUQ-68]|uniref:Uncharacterized protein n=1 Tax=Solitalea agri TaxID=2953739 RepID=A0A9X2F1S3_9SPHI|nr:hypothetical protein [Solitalea agri]MCO4293084.1 hypothetical protein [Solitalea agri]